MKKIKTVNRAMIRTLLIKQKGRCALTGIKIKPSTVSLDHIIPLSRGEFSKKKGYGKAWLVDKKINALKGSLTLEELYKFISLINKNKKNTNKLANEIINKKLAETQKEDFDKYIEKNYNKDGSIKK